MSSRGRRSADGKVVGDDFVSNFYGYGVGLPEAISSFPKSERELLRERIRQERDYERKLSALAAHPVVRGEEGLKAYVSSPRFDWDAAMRETVKITDGQVVCLGVYLVRAKDGSVEIDPESGWPVHWSYCAVGKMLHAQDPARFRNRDGGPVRQETVKGKVVAAFSKKLHAHVERYMPSVWPLELVRRVVGEQLGDKSHCVPHKR
jgi:hypothetical protein